MKEEKIFETFGDINEKYVLDARQKSFRKGRISWKRCVAAAACLCFLVAVVVMLKTPFVNSEAGTLSVLAEELGQEEYQFGASFPRIIYSDNDRAILFDFRGIYVYSFSAEKLVGYVDFIELGMDKTQGDNPTFLEVTSDGCLVRFYNASKKYIYDVNENEYVEVGEYDGNTVDSYEIPTIYWDEENAISDGQLTYLGVDGSYLAVEIDLDNIENETPRYKNMYILRKEGEILHKYFVFE